MSFISDIAALARAGYKPEEIKELMQLDKNKDAEPVDPDDKDPAADPDDADPAADPDDADPAADPDDAEPEPDYKTLYEESKKTLEKLQAKNRKDPNKRTEPKTDTDIALDYVNELFKGV